MENFIKQHSTVPQKFITDFFIIAKEEYSDNEIIIDLSVIAKWLNVDKSDIKKILIKNFEEHFDYTIEKKEKKTYKWKRCNYL